MTAEQILVDAAATAAGNGNYVMTTVLIVIAKYLRGIHSDANRAVRILEGEGGDGLIDRVDENEQRSERNKTRLDRAGIYTDGGDQDAA